MTISRSHKVKIFWFRALPLQQHLLLSRVFSEMKFPRTLECQLDPTKTVGLRVHRGVSYLPIMQYAVQTGDQNNYQGQRVSS